MTLGGDACNAPRLPVRTPHESPAMPDLYDVAAIGNAIVDVIAPCDDAFLAANGLTKGAMMLVDPQQSAAL